MMQGPIVAVHTLVAAPPARVWRAMTGRPSALFVGTEVQTDWQVCHPITFTREWQGRRFTDRGEIRSFSEAEELSFTHWNDEDGTGRSPASWHVVQYRLEPAGQLTRVTLRHFNEGQAREVNDGIRAQFTVTWTMMLEGLRAAAEARDPGLRLTN